MTLTRRRLCLAGASFALVGGSGCLGGSDGNDSGTAAADSSSDVDESEAEPSSEPADDADEGRNDGWEWYREPPVESVVQHCDPSHECCADYAEYLEYHGIEVAVAETTEAELEERKDEWGIPADARSCHTLEVGDYLVEGHVPLDAINTLLDEDPEVDGIAVPEQPRYSPGLGPNSDRPLTVYSFQEEGEVTEFDRV